MAARVGIGTVFWIPTDLGFALGIMTHKHVLPPKYGALVWIADRCFDEPPSLEDLAGVGWRWCVFFPLGTAANKHIVEIVGKVDVPEQLRNFPALRAGGINGIEPRWVVYEQRDVDNSYRRATEDDFALNIEQIVNDTRLTEMIVSGWKPEDRV